jgi:hypothetical protein
MLILKEFHVKDAFTYGVVLLKALVLAKVILIGDYMHLGERHRDKPLIFSTLYQTILFCLLAAAFTIIEDMLRGLIHGQTISVAFHEVLSTNKAERLAHLLMMFVAFIPFFAFREVSRMLGEEQPSKLLFRAKPAGRPLNP